MERIFSVSSTFLLLVVTFSGCSKAKFGGSTLGLSTRSTGGNSTGGNTGINIEPMSCNLALTDNTTQPGSPGNPLANGTTVPSHDTFGFLMDTDQDLPSDAIFYCSGTKNGVNDGSGLCGVNWVVMSPTTLAWTVGWNSGDNNIAGTYTRRVTVKSSDNEVLCESNIVTSTMGHI